MRSSQSTMMIKLSIAAAAAVLSAVAASQKAEIEKWWPIVKAANIKAQ
jgi:hypothetical protein